MKESLQDAEYDTRLWPSDWRYSAAIVGLMRFFEDRDVDYTVTDAYIEYNQEDIAGEEARENYLLFAESYFADAMHHVVAEQLLGYESLSEEQTKLLNEKLKANTICKKIFGKDKYPEVSKETLKKKIDDNRLELIQETFRSGKTMYAKFANTNRLFNEADKVSRLVGYYADLPKKSKSLAYKWDYSTYVAEDQPEFDFIVFAFTKSREGFFINNNNDINTLYEVNGLLQDSLNQTEKSSNLDNETKEVYRKNPRTYMFHSLKESATFIDFDVEVILKSQDRDFFETIYIRKEAIEILKGIKDYSYRMLTWPCRLDNGDYIACEEVVINNVLNYIRLDNLIEMLLKQRNLKNSLIANLIDINLRIYGGEYKYMEIKTYHAMRAAKECVEILKKRNAKNKINSYRQKLISALCFRDYGRFCDILMNMSAVAEKSFDFAYDLFDDFDKNKNIAYAFINGLAEENIEKKNDDVKEEK